MAINFKDLKNKIENPELTADEIKVIDELEKVIDIEISNQAEYGNYKEIKITQGTIESIIKDFPPHKINVVISELKNRYKVANWKFTPVATPNQVQSIVVVWTLRGKNQRQVKKDT